MDVCGIWFVFEGCFKFCDFCVSNVCGFLFDVDVVIVIFLINNFEWLILFNCFDMIDDIFRIMILGLIFEFDMFINCFLIFFCKFCYLDFIYCSCLLDNSIKFFVYVIFYFEGFFLLNFI